MAKGEVWKAWFERNRERVRKRQRERAARRRLEAELRGERTPGETRGRPAGWRVVGTVENQSVSRVRAVYGEAREGERTLLGTVPLEGRFARRLARALAQALGVPLGPARPRQSARPAQANNDSLGCQ
jgi:hypothetical protein